MISAPGLLGDSSFGSTLGTRQKFQLFRLKLEDAILQVLKGFTKIVKNILFSSRVQYLGVVCIEEQFLVSDRQFPLCSVKGGTIFSELSFSVRFTPAFIATLDATRTTDIFPKSHPFRVFLNLGTEGDAVQFLHFRPVGIKQSLPLANCA